MLYKLIPTSYKLAIRDGGFDHFDVCIVDGQVAAFIAALFAAFFAVEMILSGSTPEHFAFFGHDNPFAH